MDILKIIWYGILIILGIAVAAGLMSIATGLGLILLLVGVVFGIGASIYNYFTALFTNFRFEKPSIKTNVKDEPAIKSYLYGKGLNDLYKIISDTWALNFKLIGFFLNEICFKTELVLSLIYIGSAISIFLFGSIFSIIISILHFLILGSFFIILSIMFSVVLFIEKIYLHIHRYFAACPYCHTKSLLPEYLCNNCGAIHAHLIPNEYGVFYHTCQCGNKLPSTFFLNRGNLQARCVSCHQFLDRTHIESKRLFIPILGGPSVGKTSFMFSSVHQIVEVTAKKLGYETEFIDKNTEMKYNKTVQNMKDGHLPDKTVENIPKAFNLALKKGKHTDLLLYIYDPAGEAYNKTDYISLQKYNEYGSGMIFIIDPFSFNAVKNKYTSDLAKTGVSPSKLSANDALSRVLSALEESFGLSKTAKYKKPFAVVINKIDALDKNEIIFQNNNEEESHIQIKKQLEEWNEFALIQQLEARFSNFKFFKVSSLENLNNDANNLTESILWIGKSYNILKI